MTNDTIFSNYNSIFNIISINIYIHWIHKKENNYSKIWNNVHLYAYNFLINLLYFRLFIRSTFNIRSKSSIVDFLLTLYAYVFL